MREAGVVIIIKDGKILGVERKEDRTKFGIPGGKREPGETPEEGAIREVLEETGLIVKSMIHVFEREEPIRVSGGEPFFTRCWYATEWEGEPRGSEEGNFEWLDLDEITRTRSGYPEYNSEVFAALEKTHPEVLKNLREAMMPPWAKECTAAFQEAVNKAVQSHHAAGRSVPIWRDGRILFIAPDGSEHETDE